MDGVLQMGDKRMLILPTDLISKIDENRGDLSRGEFLGFLIDSLLSSELKPAAAPEPGGVPPVCAPDQL